MQQVSQGAGNIFEDPRLAFLDGSLGLLEGSPCIDAGDPVAACDAEPGPPETCHVDMGHLGNTPQAHFIE